jgi:hypothetical protein
MTEEKLNALFAALWPLMSEHILEDVDFLDRLKILLNAKPAREFGPLDTMPSFKGQLYLPEIDYFIWETSASGNFKSAGFAGRGNAVNISTAPHTGVIAPLGLDVVSGGNDSRHMYVVPCATLKTFVSCEYSVSYAWDYRMQDSRTTYLKGILDARNGNQPAKNNLRVRDIDWSINLPDTYRKMWSRYKDQVPEERRSEEGFRIWANQARVPSNYLYYKLDGHLRHFGMVLRDTRAYWERYMPDDGGNSIVTKATMMELLDKFESGELTPGKVPWHIDSMSNDLPNHKPLHEMHPSLWVNPKKISVARG